MRLKVVAITTAWILSGCAAQDPASQNTGVMVLACKGQWGGTGTPSRPETHGYRINFDTMTVEYRDVRLGTWHSVLGKRTFRVDDRTISYDGDEPGSAIQSYTTYTLQFDRQSGRVVEGTRMFPTEAHPGTVEEAFEGTCEKVDQPSGEKKF